MTLPPPRPLDPRTVPGSGVGSAGAGQEPAWLDPAGPDPAGAVDRALAGLEGLSDRPLADHVVVFERIHTALQDALAAGSGAGEAAGRP